MDQKLVDIFAPLQAGLQRLDFGTADLFHVIGNFCAYSPKVAFAMCMHCGDIAMEAPIGEGIDPQAMMIEVYRRTLFDPEHAAKYDTDDLCADHEKLQQICQYIIGSLSMKEQQTAQGSFFEDTDGRH